MVTGYVPLKLEDCQLSSWCFLKTPPTLPTPYSTENTKIYASNDVDDLISGGKVLPTSTRKKRLVPGDRLKWIA